MFLSWIGSSSDAPRTDRGATKGLLSQSQHLILIDPTSFRDGSDFAEQVMELRIGAHAAPDVGAATSTKVDRALVAQRPIGAQDRVGVDVEGTRNVPGRGQRSTGRELPICDGPAQGDRDTFVQREASWPVRLRQAQRHHWPAPLIFINGPPRELGPVTEGRRSDLARIPGSDSSV